MSKPKGMVAGLVALAYQWARYLIQERKKLLVPGIIFTSGSRDHWPWSLKRKKLEQDKLDKTWCFVSLTNKKNARYTCRETLHF